MVYQAMNLQQKNNTAFPRYRLIIYCQFSSSHFKQFFARNDSKMQKIERAYIKKILWFSDTEPANEPISREN